MFVDDKDKVNFNLDEFLFSTEAHLIPLDMNAYVSDTDIYELNLGRSRDIVRKASIETVTRWQDKSCVSLAHFFSGSNITICETSP